MLGKVFVVKGIHGEEFSFPASLINNKNVILICKIPLRLTKEEISRLEESMVTMQIIEELYLRLFRLDSAGNKEVLCLTFLNRLEDCERS